MRSDSISDAAGESQLDQPVQAGVTDDQIIDRLKALASSDGEAGIVEQGMYSEVVEHTITDLLTYWTDMAKGGADLRTMIREDIAGVCDGLLCVRDTLLEEARQGE